MRRIAAILGVIAALLVIAAGVLALMSVSASGDGSLDCGSALRPKSFKSTGTASPVKIGDQTVDVNGLAAEMKAQSCDRPISDRRKLAGAVGAVGIATALAAGLVLSQDRGNVTHSL